MSLPGPEPHICFSAMIKQAKGPISLGCNEHLKLQLPKDNHAPDSSKARGIKLNSPSSLTKMY